MTGELPVLRLWSKFFEEISPKVHVALAFIIFLGAFYLAYAYGMAFSESMSAPFWFPDTVLLTTLLLSPRKYWWLFLLASLPIRLFSSSAAGTPLWFLFASFANDSLKAAAGAWLVRRFIPDLSRLGYLRESSLFAVFTVVLTPALSAIGGAACRHSLGHDFGLAWLQWFLGDSLANLVLTYSLLHWLVFVQRPHSWRISEIIEGVFLVMAIMTVTLLAFDSQVPSHERSAALIYAPAPFLLWSALRFGPRGAASALSIVASLAIWSAAHGNDPFPVQSPQEKVLGVQLFILAIGIPMLTLAVIVEERTDVGEALRLSEERIELVAHTLSLGFWVWDPVRNRMWASEKLGSLLGFIPGETITYENFLRHLLPEDRPFVEAAIQRTIKEQVDTEFECQVRLPDGSNRWIGARGHCEFDGAGKLKQITGMSMDVTAQKLAEMQMRAQLEELAHISRLAAVGELTASIAHEVNQPLAAILSNAEAAELLLASPSPPLDSIREILSDIRADDARASEIGRRLRSLLRKQELQFKPLDFNKLVAETLPFVAHDARRRGVTFTTCLAPNLPEVHGDKLHLQQVLLNLFLNGMDAMGDSPAAERLLTIHTRLEWEDRIECIIKDKGHGISEERLPKLFDSFFTTKKSGVGLGLSIARSIVEAHRGQIWAENNRKEGGAAFHIVLRAASSELNDGRCLNPLS